MQMARCVEQATSPSARVTERGLHLGTPPNCQGGPGAMPFFQRDLGMAIRLFPAVKSYLHI